MNLKEMSDEDLMQTYVSADQAATKAFEVLYTRHESAMLRFLRRLMAGGRGTSAAQADEIFQETWLKIIQARQSFNAQTGKFKTWAYAVAHNTAMDYLRRTKPEVPMSEYSEVDDHTALDWLQANPNMTPTAHSQAASAPEDTHYWRRAGVQLLHCLEGLPPLQRAAFLLHYEDGESVERLANSLQINFETAKSRLRYALQKLRGCMGSYLEGIEV